MCSKWAGRVRLAEKEIETKGGNSGQANKQATATNTSTYSTKTTNTLKYTKTTNTSKYYTKATNTSTYSTKAINTLIKRISVAPKL